MQSSTLKEYKKNPNATGLNMASQSDRWHQHSSRITQTHIFHLSQKAEFLQKSPSLISEISKQAISWITASRNRQTKQNDTQKRRQTESGWLLQSSTNTNISLVVHLLPRQKRRKDAWSNRSGLVFYTNACKLFILREKHHTNSYSLKNTHFLGLKLIYNDENLQCFLLFKLKGFFFTYI